MKTEKNPHIAKLLFWPISQIEQSTIKMIWDINIWTKSFKEVLYWSFYGLTHW
jgi:hypothetical protein